MTRRALHTSTSIRTYDQARWEEWVPDVQHVHADPDGLSMLYQMAPAGRTDRNEVDVDAADAAILLLWTQGLKRGEAKFDGRLTFFDLQPWTGVLLPPGLPSWWVGDDRSTDHVLHFHIAGSKLRRVAEAESLPPEKARLPASIGYADPVVNATAHWLLDEVARGGTPSRLMWDTSATMLSLRLFNGARPVAPLGTRKGGLAPWQARRTTEYLADRIGAEVSLEELAAIAGLSPFHFARAFKQSVGLPPHRYQLRLRLERAKEMLTGSDLSVTDIAAAVGYDAPQTLARLFRREIGTSPSEYRRERRA